MVDVVATVGVDFIFKGHYDQHVPSELPAVPRIDALCD